jgi:RNA polymerase sigma-70 factor, ECF subfamily
MSRAHRHLPKAPEPQKQGKNAKCLPEWAVECRELPLLKHPAARNSVLAADTERVMGEPTDAELWQRAAGGEPSAFGVLFERHGRAVYNYCFRRTANWSQAEELTSVVFLEAWRRRKDVQLEGERALPWLLGVATNVLRNSWRSQRRHRAALARLPLERGYDFSTDVDERLDDERQMRAVLASVAQLPSSDQDVLALCVWEGLGYEETAAALGAPVGTVRSRLSRARARLRELTEEDGHEWDEPAVPIRERRAI